MQDSHDRVIELVEESQEMSLNSDRLDMYEAAIRELVALYTAKRTDNGDATEGESIFIWWCRLLPFAATTAAPKLGDNYEND